MSEELNFRNKKELELMSIMGELKEYSPLHIAAKAELKRRSDASSKRRFLGAIAISVVSLIVSIIALIRSW